MAGRIPETLDELEGRRPEDEREAYPHLPLWQAVLLLTAGAFLLVPPSAGHTAWSLLRGGGLLAVGLASILARAEGARRFTALLALVGVLAWIAGVLAWLIRNLF